MEGHFRADGTATKDKNGNYSPSPEPLIESVLLFSSSRTYSKRLLVIAKIAPEPQG
jgi:hypothetical protein